MRQTLVNTSKRLNSGWENFLSAEKHVLDTPTTVFFPRVLCYWPCCWDPVSRGLLTTIPNSCVV